MKKEDHTATRLESISDVHRALDLPKPLHPLISLFDATERHFNYKKLPPYNVLNFYKITFITKLSGKLQYGQGHYDFDEGSMLFAAPGQIIGSGNEHTEASGYSLLIHPDYFQGYPLAKKVRQYCFFSYSSNEALHLSDQENAIIRSIYTFIKDELNSRIDDYSQDVVIAQIDLLLTYAGRFYKRQFLTRKPFSNDLLQKLEELLNAYFDDERSLTQGIPTVQYLADHLNYSASYLSDMLRSLTGQGAQQHIHDKLIEKAKEKLSTTSLTVSEVAYILGFEHPQSFSKLFKTKTNLSPLEFRRSFN